MANFKKAGNHPATGTGTGTVGRIRRLLAEHREIVDALETTLGLLNGHATASVKRRADMTLAAAIDVDRARVQTTRGTTTKRKRKRARIGARSQTQRQQSAAFLARFDLDEPKVVTGFRGLGSLVRRGYLKSKGDGYIRTAKEFTV